MRTVVELLGAGFVRFEDRRIPTDTFLLEMRERVRLADGEPSRLPAVHVRADPDAPLGPIDGFLQGLRTAGVRYVVLE
ncbi:MAG: hypothetical protein R3F56_08770 [Planctomycetota bacterium]